MSFFILPRTRAPLQTINGQIVAVDIAGQFLKPIQENSFILVVSDYSTRWVEAYSIPNQKAATVACKLMDEFFLHFSPTEQLNSDEGCNFESELLAETCKNLWSSQNKNNIIPPKIRWTC